MSFFPTFGTKGPPVRKTSLVLCSVFLLAGCGGSESTGARLAKNVAKEMTSQVTSSNKSDDEYACRSGENTYSCGTTEEDHQETYAATGPCEPEDGHPGYNWICNLNNVNNTYPNGSQANYLVDLESDGCWTEVPYDEPNSELSYSKVKGCLK
jgi:hypothetical protein